VERAKKELRVADLSAEFDPKHWAELWADFAVDWRTERAGVAAINCLKKHTSLIRCFELWLFSYQM